MSAAAVANEIQSAVQDELSADDFGVVENAFGGWDFRPFSESAREGMTETRSAQFVRIAPVDGDFDYGTSIYVFSSNEVLLASVELRAGNASPALIAAVARDLWSVR